MTRLEDIEAASLGRAWANYFMAVLMDSVPTAFREVPCLNPRTCTGHAKELEVVVTFAGATIDGWWLE